MQFIYHHRTAGRGGEGVHITSVVNALKAAGHRVDLVSPPRSNPLRPTASAPLDKGAADASGIVRLWKWISCSCPQFLFELIELSYNFYAAARLLPRLCRRAPSVYYGRHAFFLCAGTFLARAFGKPVILEVNEVAGIPRARSQTFVRLARWLELQTFSRADEIITVSAFLQREVLRLGGREGHVHVVPNAIDPSAYRRTGQGAKIRERLGLSGTSILGFVGWFDRWDRLDRLIDLLKELHGDYPALRLLLVGDGPVARELAERVEREGLGEFVVLSGPVAHSKVPDYIDAMDICILPDATEFCSPLVLFEFMAMGKPVIVPDVEPLKEVLTHAATGWIIDRRDPTALRRAVERFLNDPALGRRIGHAARASVFREHTWSAVATFIEQLAMRHVETGARARVTAVSVPAAVGHSVVRSIT